MGAGSYVWYMSDTKADHGLYGVSIDSGVWHVLSSTSATYGKQEILLAAELSPGAHTLTIMNLEENKYAGIDQFMYVW